jgi:hypothetical protein
MFRKILSGCIALLAINVSGVKAGEYIINNRALDDAIRIAASSDFGGSITSLVFRGKEYIDAADKGRELQSASAFDGLDECYNPTEAGTSYDKQAPSSSKLIHAEAKRNILETQTNMAFWRMPGELQPGGRCGTRTDLQVAQNSTILSGHLLSKRVEIGCCGIPNAIRYDVTYSIPRQYSKARFEAVSLHTPPDFNLAFQYDPAKDALQQVEEKKINVTHPIVLSTSDSRHSIGLYCPNAINDRARTAFYSFKLWPQTSVARCVFLEEPIKSANYAYQGFLFVGNLDEVRNAMKQYFLNNR